MKNQLVEHAMGIPVSSVAYLPERSPKRLLQDCPSNGSLILNHNKENRMTKLGGKEKSLTNGIRELGNHFRASVLIPVGKLLSANEIQNVKRPSRKYIEIVTVDNFDFWFMGFLNFRRTFNYLQQALSDAQ
ncbi:hypothetical protein Acr_00g0064220 [Actinidia rufa]|uniref:GRAM domain-containing protein n=1 Tax=Actinidia rufa TaxID=165716 RepID=A0A7J0DQV4_9ERIC|nr:hypothetical protein Acr_00g0064220 [Actinidia rufa]